MLTSNACIQTNVQTCIHVWIFVKQKDNKRYIFSCVLHQFSPNRIYIYMQIKQIEYFLYLNYIFYRKIIKIKIIKIFFLSFLRQKCYKTLYIYIYTDLVRTCRYSICWNSCLQTCLCSIFFWGVNYGLYSICWILTIYTYICCHILQPKKHKLWSLQCNMLLVLQSPTNRYQEACYCLSKKVQRSNLM